MTNELMLQVILAVSMYCAGGNNGNAGVGDFYAKRCFRKIWICGHQTKEASVIPSLIHNCITDDLEGKLK